MAIENTAPTGTVCPVTAIPALPLKFHVPEESGRMELSLFCLASKSNVNDVTVVVVVVVVVDVVGRAAHPR